MEFDFKKFDYTSLNIQELKSKIEELNNKLNYYLKKKEQAFNMTQPKVAALKEVSVTGGNRVNLFEQYVMTNEQLDPIIDFLNDEIKIVNDLLNKEINRINKYDEWEQKVIYLKQAGNSWLYIACNTPFSIRTCQRIYRQYLNKKENKKD